MHPAFFSWWKHARQHRRDFVRAQADFGSGSGFGCGGPDFGGRGFGRHGGPEGRGGPHDPRGDGDGPSWFGPMGGHGHGPHGGPGRFGGEDGGPFGVRRPLRFLANKLELSEAQVSDLARIIEELKTERAQAEVDQRRTITAFADALEGETFGEARAKEGGELRVKSAERLRDAVSTALARIHALLDEEQRKRFSYLVRTGVVSL